MVLAFVGTVFGAWSSLDRRLAVLESKHEEFLQRLVDLQKEVHATRRN
jgi:hypothetical protein